MIRSAFKKDLSTVLEVAVVAPSPCVAAKQWSVTHERAFEHAFVNLPKALEREAVRFISTIDEHARVSVNPPIDFLTGPVRYIVCIEHSIDIEIDNDGLIRRLEALISEAPGQTVPSAAQRTSSNSINPLLVRPKERSGEAGGHRLMISGTSKTDDASLALLSGIGEGSEQTNLNGRACEKIDGPAALEPLEKKATPHLCVCFKVTCVQVVQLDQRSAPLLIIAQDYGTSEVEKGMPLPLSLSLREVVFPLKRVRSFTVVTSV